MNSKIHIIGISVGLVLLLAAAATWVWAQDGETVYYACVNNSSGTIHMVGPTDTCGNNEILIEWNQVGPPGPAGSQGECSCEISRAEFDALVARVEALGSQQCEDSDLDGYGIGPGCLGSDCDDGNPEVHPGAIEVCDGIDNDCDGEVDEEFPTQGECDGPDADLCPEGVMECVAGSLVCSDNTGDNEEVCDGIDNDCDREVDEDFFPDLDGTCSVGVGQCQRTGPIVCRPDGQGTECSVSIPGPPEPESCDGVDNDCDGETDEGCP